MNIRYKEYLLASNRDECSMLKKLGLDSQKCLVVEYPVIHDPAILREYQKKAKDLNHYLVVIYTETEKYSSGSLLETLADYIIYNNRLIPRPQEGK